jgi:hypothetical protein
MNPADVKAALERREKHKDAVEGVRKPKESPYYQESNGIAWWAAQREIDSDLLADYAIAMQPVMVKMLDVCRAMLPWVEREVYYRDQEAKKHLPVLATAIAEAEKLVPEEVSRGS